MIAGRADPRGSACLRCNGNGIGHETMLCIRCGGSGNDPRSLPSRKVDKPAEASAPVAEPARWLIYSREHNAFWRADRAGYTGVLATAGRYTRADAEANCRMRDPQPDGSPSEILLAAPEAIAALEAENEKLREGLRPFSADAIGIDEEHPDDLPVAVGYQISGITVGDFRRARALLQGQGQGGA
jgi:hypothetical protein